MTTPAWLGMLDETLRESSPGRPELANRLRQLRGRLLQPTVRVLVAGGAKEGKSQLVNAMLGAPVCPVADHVTTSVPMLLRYAESPHAELLKPLDPQATVRGIAYDEIGERLTVPVDKVAAELAALAGAHRDRELVRAEVGLPRELLGTGLVLVDCPSVDTLGDAEARAVLADVDIVLVVSGALRTLGSTELDFLREATDRCASVASVRTKTDLVTGWRDLVRADGDALAALPGGVRTFAASSTLRLQAARIGNQQLNTESGFPHLITYLKQQVQRRDAALSGRTAARAVISAVDEVLPQERSRLVVRAPSEVSPPMERVQAAQRQSDLLRRHTTRWQHALSDGMADLMSDVDHDLRDRTRAILRESDRVFNRVDPLKVWDEFSAWLVENLSEAVLRNFSWAAERTRWLTQYLGEYFTGIAGEQRPRLHLELPDEVERKLADLEKPELEPVRIGHKVVTGLRGSYSGVLMFGLLGTFSGLPLINPVSLGAGAFLGARSIRDDKVSQLRRRQATAKTAVQRHIDEAVFQSSKYGKDALRRVQRALRNHFTLLTEELQDAAAEAVSTATRAANLEATERDKRNREIAGQVDRLLALRKRAESLLGTRSIAA